MLPTSILLPVFAIFGGVLLVTGLCGAILARSRGRAARFRSAAVGVVGLSVSLFALRGIAAADVVPESEAMVLLDKMHEVPDLAEDESVWGWTDHRSPVRLYRAELPRPAEELRLLEFDILTAQRRQGRVLRRQDADDRTNCFGWPCDEEAEKLRRAYITAADEVARRTALVTLHQRLWESLPTIPVGQYVTPYAARSNVKGILHSAPIVFWNVDKD